MTVYFLQEVLMTIIALITFYFVNMLKIVDFVVTDILYYLI